MNKILMAVLFSVLLFQQGIACAEDLELQIVNYKKVYQEKDKIEISVQIQNRGLKSVVVPALFVPEHEYVSFFIEDKNGRRVAYKGPESDVMLFKSDLYRLRTDAFVGCTINLGKFYDIKPGEYTVYATYRVPNDTHSTRAEKESWVGNLVSEKIHFVVK